MREQTFPYDHRVLAGFPGARSYERTPEADSTMMSPSVVSSAVTAITR